MSLPRKGPFLLPLESMAELQDKLGLKPDMRTILMREPKGYSESLPILGQTRQMSRLTGWFDFIQYFASSRQQLSAVFVNLAQHLELAGMLWISWPKQGSALAEPDLNENVVRELGLAAGLVDVKVAAIDEDWSGLKFVRRLADR
jgi:hypothetical protein